MKNNSTVDKRLKYIQRTSGEVWSEPTQKKVTYRCCDCGLTHEFVFVAGKRKHITVGVKVNRIATNNTRRSQKYRKSIRALAKKIK